jgi:anti-sigma B factor antagonist
MDEKEIIEITSRDNIGIVTFQSACISDTESINAARQQITDFIDRNRPIRLIFDFEKVKFFSSQVLGLILEIRSRLKIYDGELAIIAINPQLHRVFRITNLDKIFRFYPDMESAIAVKS